jgi:hypothetical protein
MKLMEKMNLWIVANGLHISLFCQQNPIVESNVFSLCQYHCHVVLILMELPGKGVN